MSNKSLTALVGAAVVLCAAAYLTTSTKSSSASNLAGKPLLPDFDIAKVAAIEVGDAVKLSAGADGWTVATYQDYPADMAKIRENLLKLSEAKVGQVARGRSLKEKTDVVLRDDSGKELAKVILGDMHEKWGRGRYALKDGTTVLVGDRLDAFGTDPKNWLNAKIVDEPYVSFHSLAAVDLGEAEFGFATGVVAKVTIAGDTNRVATIGNALKDGSERYMKLDGTKWVFVVPSYSVEKLLPKPEPEAPESPESPEPPAPTEALTSPESSASPEEAPPEI